MDKPDHVEHGGEVHADTPDKWSADDKARQEQGLPKSSATPITPDSDDQKSGDTPPR